MSKKFIARTAKLLTESKRGHGKKGVAITYEHIPRDIDERNHGSIYAVININAQTAEAEDIAELIIDAFHGEYYQDLTRDPLTSFEAALAKVNEELAEATHQGNVSWLKNLNAILAVLTDQTLHMSKAGKVEAYLYRGEKSSHISEDLAGDTMNPLRTFINIASGDLIEGDKVAVVTPGVFFHVSKDELQKYTLDFQPRVAISHLADLLEGNSNEVNPNAILLLEMISPEAASNETIEEQPDEVWISEPAKPVQTAIDALAPFAKKIFTLLGSAFIATKVFIADKLIPFGIESYHRSAELIGSFVSSKKMPKFSKEKILVETEESISTPEKPRENLDDLTINDSSEKINIEEEKPEPVPAQKSTGHEIFIKETAEKPKWVKLEKVNFSLASDIFRKFKKLTRRLTAKRGQLLITLVVVVVVLVGGIYLIWHSRQDSAQAKAVKITLAEAQGEYTSGQNAISSGDKVTATNTLDNAEAAAETIQANGTVGKTATLLLANIKTALNKAQGTVNVNPRVFANAQSIVGKTPFGPYLIGSSLYLINRDSGSIAAINTNSGEVANILDNPSLNGKVIAATAVTMSNALVLYTSSGAIYLFNVNSTNLTKESTSGNMETPVAMTSFYTNIYTLDGTTGVVYKRLKTSSGYGARTSYITDGSTINGATGLASDSSIYCLDSSGNVTKYLAGKKQAFSLTNLPFSIDHASSIFTDESVQYLYLTDSSKNRILVFDKNGVYQDQQVSSEFSNLTGIWVDGSTGYVSANGNIYKINL